MPSQSPIPDSTEEPLVVDLPGFRPPPPPVGPDPLDPTTTTTGTSPETPDQPPDDRGWSSGSEPAGATTEPGGSRTQTPGSSRASTADPLAFVEIGRQLVAIASLLVRALRQRRRPNLHPQAWLADDEDQAAIGDPLARIAARHTPLTGEGSEDVADGFAVLIGTTGYAMKGLAAEAEADGGGLAPTAMPTAEDQSPEQAGTADLGPNGNYPSRRGW